MSSLSQECVGIVKVIYMAQHQVREKLGEEEILLAVITGTDKNRRGCIV